MIKRTETRSACGGVCFLAVNMVCCGLLLGAANRSAAPRIVETQSPTPLFADPLETPQIAVARDPGAYTTLDQPFVWELVWRPETDVKQGDLIELRSRNLRDFISWSFQSVRLEHAELDKMFISDPNQGLKELFTNKRFARVRLKMTADVEKGTPLALQITAVPSYELGINETVSLWRARPSDAPQTSPDDLTYESLGFGLLLKMHPGAVDSLAVQCWPNADPQGRVRVVVTPEDKFGNPTAFAKPIDAVLYWNEQPLSLTIQQTSIFYLPAPNSAVGRLVATVSPQQLAENESIKNSNLSDGTLKITSNPVWKDPPEGMKAAFGEFHWHTDISGDGSGRIEDGLALARDYINMNFCMSSDHFFTRPADWERTVRAHQEFSQPDIFATLLAFEYSTSAGHDNYYFYDPDHSMATPKFNHLWTPPKQPILIVHLQELLAKHWEKNPGSFFAVPHHTNAHGKPYWGPYPFGQIDPATPWYRLIEVFQTRGNMERNEYPEGWRAWFLNNNSSVIDALNLGFKLGFTGGTDNHCARPGRVFAGSENIGRIPTNSLGLTGVWTPRVERTSLFKSLYDRMTWAVWDTRAIVWFTVNGQPMGGELSLSAGQPLQAVLRMSVESPLKVLEIVSDGKAVWSGGPEGLDFELTIPLDVAQKSGYYYVRALQQNGGIIYASPVFIRVE